MEELPSALRALRSGASNHRSLPARIWGLWKAEGLAYSCADRDFDRVDFAVADLPLETGPPVHCGLSMAAVLHLGFDAGRLEPWLRRHADPRFVDFAFESLGLMLAAYERDAFGRLIGLFGHLGVLRRYRLETGDQDRFLGALDEPERLLAAHGYGRLLYFKHASLGGTIRAIERRSFLARDAAVKGALAAYTLVNSHDLPSILRLYGSTDDAIRSGLDNVLTLIEWSIPGTLQAVCRADDSLGEHLEQLSLRARKRREERVGPGMVA